MINNWFIPDRSEIPTVKKYLLVTLSVIFTSVGMVSARSILPPAPDIDANSFVLIDANSEVILAQHNIEARVAPASLTKIMTALIVEEEVKAGRTSYDEEVEVSVKAWRTGGSKMFIREGTKVSVRDLLRGVIVQSGNDASIALAEHVAGGEAEFAYMMNEKARRLGLQNTNFVNATGLPSDNHFSTAIDLARLTMELVKSHPNHYEMYAERSFEYNGINQTNRNKLLWRDLSVDGVKTGYTQKAGYCLIASAKRDGMRLVSVVLGTSSDQDRMKQSQKLLSFGFRNYDTQLLYGANSEITRLEVFYGKSDNVAIIAPTDVYVTAPRGDLDLAITELSVPKYLEAPINKNEVIGTLSVMVAGEDEIIYETEVLTGDEISEASLFGKLSDFFYLFYSELFGE